MSEEYQPPLFDVAILPPAYDEKAAQMIADAHAFVAAKVKSGEWNWQCYTKREWTQDGRDPERWADAPRYGEPGWKTWR